MKDMNLIPIGYLKRKNRPKFILSGIAVSFVIIALLCCLYIIQLNTIRALEQEISKYDEVVIEYSELKSLMDKMQENEAAIKKKLDILDKISGGEVKPSRVFTLVYGSMPKDVWLTSLDYTFTDVSLTAVSESAAGAAEFYVELGKKSEFKEVKLSPITIDEMGYNFTIQFSLSTGSEGAR